MALVRTPANPPRFAGDFSLGPAAGATADPGEQAYAQTVTTFLLRCAADEAEDKRRDPEGKSATVVARGRARASLVRTLGDDADQTIAGTFTVPVAQQRAAVDFGRYQQIIDQLARRLFKISLELDDSAKLATDLRMEIKPAQAEDDPQPSDAQRQLFVAIGATATLLSGVHARDVASRSRSWWRWFGPKPSKAAPAPRMPAVMPPQVGPATPPVPAAPAGAAAQAATKARSPAPASLDTAANRLQDEFVRKLEDVARIGLEGNRPAIASLALADLQNQFTGRVAGRIKNTYARSLGAACLIAALACVLMRLCIGYRWGVFADGWWVSKQSFLMLFLGAALGTWLSFLVRRVSLTFEDLAIVEADLLDPSLRILFVLGLTTLVGLLFWTDAVQIAIGGMQTANFRTNGAISVLLGAFCGLSERSLATAIAGRAASFVGGLAAKEGSK